MVTGDEFYEGSEDENDDVRELDEGSNSHIRQLSYGDAGSKRGQVMEIRARAPQDKIDKLEESAIGQMMRYNGSRALPMKMKGTRHPQDDSCEPFSLCLDRAAKI